MESNLFKTILKPLLFFGTLVWLNVSFGDQLETKVRNYYRSEICKCDTLRPKVIYENNIPYINNYTVNGDQIGIQTNYVLVAQTALKAIEDFKNGKVSRTKQFDYCTSFLLKNLVTKYSVELQDSFSVFEYKYPWKPYQIDTPWVSAMSLGIAMQVFNTAYDLTSEKKYLEANKKMLNSFFLSVEEGGVTYKTANGWWYEEYAHTSSNKPHVLNGMLHALDGVVDYYLISGDSSALQVYNRGVKAVSHLLPEYDRLGGSNYDILGYPASWKYHNLHVELLENLLEYRKEDVLLKYYKKWKNITEPNYLLKRIVSPNKTFALINVVFAIGIISLLTITKIWW